MMTQNKEIRKARAEFQRAIEFVVLASTSDKLRIDEVERTLFELLLRVGYQLLKAFITAAGDGDQGETVEHQGRILYRSTEKMKKIYRSIFGVLCVLRYVYRRGTKKKAEWLPVDAKLGLPAGQQSYVLEDWTQRMCIKESFAEGVGSLRHLLRVKTSVRAAEVMARNVAKHTDGFNDTQGNVDPKTEQSLIVLSADGKGVPMRRPLEERLREHQAASVPDPSPPGQDAVPSSDSSEAAPVKKRQKRLKRGEKRTRKQMAYVAAVYSVAPFERTTDQIMDELQRKERQAQRPRPQNKQLYAEMTRFHEGEVLDGQERCFARLAQLALKRAPSNKTLICLMDGQRSLWNLKESWFPRAVGILDLFHAAERLRPVAYAFHGEGTREAEQQVDLHLRYLLEGKVGYVIGVYKRMLDESGLKGAKAKTVREAITYFENNKQYMKYDEYLAKGYPIATGVVEGACRHFIKDRMELAGMRWEIEGAQAILSERALYLNDQWDAFIDYRIHTEQQQLYGQAA